MLHEAQRTTPASSGEALTELYRLYATEAYRFAVHLTGRKEDAEDVLQQVFLQAHRHLESGADLVNPRAWLMLAVKHRVYNLQRDRRETPSDGLEPVGALAEPTEEAAELAAVRGVLWTLPEKQHQAFVLRYWSGLSQSEIAQVLGTTASAVESLLVRARTTLISERANGSDECERVRHRLVEGDQLSDRNHDHLQKCTRCRAGQLRLSRVAQFASAVSLVPSLHVAHGLASLVPGFSAPVAGLSAVGAPAAAGASTVAGTTTVTGVSTAASAATASGKLAMAVKVALAVAATTTATVAAVPPIHSAVDNAIFPHHAVTAAAAGKLKPAGWKAAATGARAPGAAVTGTPVSTGGNVAGGKAVGKGNGKALGKGSGNVTGPGTGKAKGAGNGNSNGSAGGSATGKANGAGNGKAKGAGNGTGQAKGGGNGNGQAKGAGNGNGQAKGAGNGNGQAKGAANGSGPAKGAGNGNGSAMGGGTGNGNAKGAGTGNAKGTGNGASGSSGTGTTTTGSNGNGTGSSKGNGKG